MTTFKLIGPSLIGLGSLIAISSCGSNGGGTTTPPATTPTPTPTPAAVPGIYVFQSIAGSPPVPCVVLMYPKSANGIVTPTTVITGPTNFECESIAIDSTGNLYLGGQNFVSAGVSLKGGVILVYAPGAATPTRTITPIELAQSTSAVSALAVDGSGNIFAAGGVLTGNSIGFGVAEYPATATGNATATRVISGTATTISGANQIAVDSADNLYIAQFPLGPGPSSILIFNSLATGNVAPTATLGGSNTGIYSPRGLALDKGGDVYVVSEAAGIQTPNGILPGAVSIFEFAIGATGNVAPTRTISGSASALENFGITVDSTNGNIYTIAHSSGLPAILVFPSTASGNATPSATFYTTNPLLEFNSLVPALF